MKLEEALHYGVLADFRSGDKQDQFDGLLQTVAKDPVFGMGVLADFAEDHNHPLAPVFRRLANGEGRVGDYRQQAEELIDHAEAGPHVPLHLKTKKNSDPAAYLSLYHHHSEGPVWRLASHLGWKDGEWPQGHSVILPARPEEIEAFRKGLEEDGVAHRAREVGDFQARSENMQHYKTLEDALKYVTAKPEDMLHLLPHSGNASSLIWADLLDDHHHSDLAARVRREAEGSAVKRPQPEEGSSSQDDVQHLLHLKHPSPAIRALADGGESPVNTDYLVRALRLSPNHFDQDAGVWLAQGDIPHPHHAAKTHFDNLSNRQYAEAGLVPKLVGDTLYLLDWEHTPEELRDGYHAPAIRYHAPISDRKDLDGMIQHAEQLRSERQGL